MIDPEDEEQWITAEKTVKRVARLSGVVMVIAIAVAVAGLTTVVFRFLDDDDVWAPLGEYPIQTVVEVTPTEVVVEGTKCNDTGDDVAVDGTFGWQRVDPLGAIIQAGRALAVRIPGCTTTEFVNIIPHAVRANDGDGFVWRIVGEEVPIRDDEPDGVPVRWQTETFTLTPTPLDDGLG